MDQVTFEINGKKFEAYYVQPEDKFKDLEIMVKVIGRRFPTKQEYRDAEIKAKELLNG